MILSASFLLQQQLAVSASYHLPCSPLRQEPRSAQVITETLSVCSSGGFIFIFYLTGMPSSLHDTSLLFGRTSRLDWNMRKLAEMDHPGRGRKRA